MITSIFRSISDFFNRIHNYNEVDDYLSRAVSPEDLERRIKNLQRNGKL